MDLGLGQRARDAEEPPPAVRVDADSGEHGGVPHDPALTDLLVAGVEHEIGEDAEVPLAPGP